MCASGSGKRPAGWSHCAEGGATPALRPCMSPRHAAGSTMAPGNRIAPSLAPATAGASNETKDNANTELRIVMTPPKA
ncbi:hypothetical protein G6F24_018315 [Rhizopus arrhizus]|nr:hypothetical protein G6F24_018315 [Rhizopus arrhizus]